MSKHENEVQPAKGKVQVTEALETLRTIQDEHV